MLKSVSSDLQGTELEPWQQDRIVKNHVIAFREFREITLFDAARSVIATSRIGQPRISVPEEAAQQTFDGVAMSPIRLDQDLLPTAVFSIRTIRRGQPNGWLVGEISLEQMWRMVDQIRIGEHGFALVVAPDGALIAHGDPDKKALVAQARNMRDHHPLVAGSGQPASLYQAEYIDDDGREQLAVSARIPALNWTVIVEQPTSEAYAGARALARQLTVAIALALLVMIGVGLLFGRRFIAPIFKLKAATQAVAGGNLETRVDIGTEDEFGQLGDAFNTMANRLVDLTENVKRQERQAMFGRVVGGLFHDLMHPIQNIGNNARLLIRPELDAEARQQTHVVIERELGVLKRFMDDVLNIAKPKPLQKFPMDVNSSVSEIVDAMRGQGESAGIAVEGRYASEPVTIEGDRFSLGRVYRNLIKNAIQATAPGGRVSVTTARVGDIVEISVTDTGSGIPPERLSKIFDDFVTTKSRGLGLGLAISKQTVEQLGGTINVTSEVGRGTSFTLRFPARDDLTTQAAAS
ncbi:MAG TPA: sensor histidine kinase [Vicinamibacterales bacterium]|nr:sensor histidine kinase [Vicinamibacterales bacterium]